MGKPSIRPIAQIKAGEFKVKAVRRVKIKIIRQLCKCLIVNYELQGYISSSPCRIQIKCYFVHTAVTPSTSGFQGKKKKKRKEGKQNDISCTLYTHQKVKSRRQRSLHEAENSC